MVKLGVALCLLLEHGSFAAMQKECSANVACSTLDGDCCPTAEGFMLDCCHVAPPASLNIPSAAPPPTRDSVLTKALSKQTNSAHLAQQVAQQRFALQQHLMQQQALQHQALQQQQALQQAALRQQEALLKVVQVQEVVAVKPQAEEPEIEFEILQEHRPALPESAPVLSEEETVQEQVVQERLLELEVAPVEPTDPQPEVVAGLQNLVAELKARLDAAEQQMQKTATSELPEPEEPPKEVLPEDEAPLAQEEEELPAQEEVLLTDQEHTQEEVPTQEETLQEMALQPIQEEELPIQEAVEQKSIQEVLLLQQQSLEELIHEEQAQEDFVVDENLTVPETAPVRDHMVEMQESVQGLSVSVKELWSCVTELLEKTEENAKVEQEEVPGCDVVTAEYVHKYARTYAQEYTRQYVHAYHKLLRDKAQQTETASVAETASVEACDANETLMTEDTLLQPGEDGDGIVLELPAFKTALSSVQTPA